MSVCTRPGPQAEAKAQKNKKGMHSAKESPVNHINDLSLREAAHKARQYLPFLQRGGRLHAVVEVVLSGHRMKLYIPKENVMVVFSLAGVRAPGRVKDTVEPFADEALAFTRRRCLQHDVEVEVENVDKTGTFLGTLHLNGGRVNLGQAILESGLASLHPMFNPERAVNGHELKQCEHPRASSSCAKICYNTRGNRCTAHASHSVSSEQPPGHGLMDRSAQMCISKSPLCGLQGNYMVLSFVYLHTHMSLSHESLFLT